jgi:DNA-binding NarL/FixJ family response regulator
VNITIVVADDHPIIRQGLRFLLETQADLRVVGQAANGLEAIELAERLRPDVLVVDLMMPELNGLEVTYQLTQRAVPVRVVLLSIHGDEAHVMQALQNGAHGYVLKDADESEVITAVREAAADRRYLSRPLSARVIDAYVRQAQATVVDPLQILTDREREVLQLAAQGFTNADIGAKLNISPRTASTHRAHILHKLDLHNQTDVVRFAIEHGLLPRSR